MENLFSPPTLIGLGLVILLTGGIILGLRLVGLPHDIALYLAVCVIAVSGTLFYGRWQRRR